MANINLTSPVFYKSGQGGVSAVVGYESLCNRVVRYTLRTGASGAGRVSLAFSGNWEGHGTYPKLRFYIGTDPESHINAGRTAPFTGELSRSGYNYAGTAEIMLLPDADYYVWVFPATETFGWIQWSYAPGAAVADVSGGALTQLTAEPGVLGSPMALTLSRYADFTHTVTCTLGDTTLTVAENTAETALTFTPPLTLAWEMPNAVTAQAVFTVTSLRDGAPVGSQQTAVNLTVPDSVCPTVTARWQDLSDAYGRFGTCVQLISRLGVEAEAQGVYGSTVQSSVLTLNGQPYSGGVLMEAGDHTLTVTVTDSRGRTGSATHIVSVGAYAVPWVRMDASRCDADGTPNDMGEYAKVTFTGSTAQLPGNTAALSFDSGDGARTEPVPLGQLTLEKIVYADSTKTLTFRAVLQDGVCASPVFSTVLSIGYATVDFYAGGRGIAFGTTATGEGFTCAMDTDFSGHRVTGLPAPENTADAANKAYVDAAVAAAAPQQPAVYLDVAANVPVELPLAEGELVNLCFISTRTATGDVFLLANGQKPTAADYSFSTNSGHFTDGQISYTGNKKTVFCATARIQGGVLVVCGTDIRGNNTGAGMSLLLWDGLQALETITFSAPGSLMIRRDL